MKDLAGGFGTNQIENIRRKEKRCGGVTLPLFRLIGTALLLSPRVASLIFAIDKQADERDDPPYSSPFHLSESYPKKK
jgi:hypothetical protein